MTFLAIALNAGTPVQRNEITKFFSSKNWPYWHWIDDFWIVQVPREYTPKVLHDNLEKLPEVGEPTMLVFEFNGDIKYWGRNKNEAWDWLGHIGRAE